MRHTGVSKFVATCVMAWMGVSISSRAINAQSVADIVNTYWTAKPERLDATIQHIIDSETRFDDVYEMLQSGIRFQADVPTGRLEMVRTNRDGTPHPYIAIVPSQYDPTRSYPIRMYLHGGVRRPAWDSDGQWWRRYEELARDDEIAVFPAAWDESIWWQASQVENLAGILRDLKTSYNVDDNRVYLFGVSDGGTGVYFQAFRAPTPWAAFVPMIGHPAVLSNPRVGTDGETYPVNLWNRPFYVLNGETDRLYPARLMRPWVQFFQGRGVDMTFRPVDAGHTVEWWPEEAAGIEQFITSKMREPHPQRIVWETERTDRYNRLHWLIIDELGPAGTHPEEVPNDPFPHSSPSGRVEAERHGNNVIIESRGVARLTLLFSPAVFDFSAPVTVTINGREQWQGMLEANLDLLLHWAARDRDRSMLYGASKTVIVAGATGP